MQCAADVAVACTAARRLAAAVGLDARAQWELATAVAEAASNIVKHAGSGRVSLRAAAGGRPCVELEAVDRGPGIPQLDLARRDGVTGGRAWDPWEADGPRPSLGCGLGAIERLMDDVRVESAPGAGTRVIARKLGPPRPPPRR